MPLAVYLGTGNSVSIAVFDLDSRLRLPGAAKGRRGVIGNIVSGENTALLPLIIGN